MRRFHLNLYFQFMEFMKLFVISDNVLGSEGDAHQLSLEVLQDGMKVKTPDDDPSLVNDIGENSSDQILHNEHELHVTQLKQETGNLTLDYSKSNNLQTLSNYHFMICSSILKLDSCLIPFLSVNVT